MTTLATVTPDTGPQPVGWPRLAWVAWRQHRAALAGAATVLGGLSLLLLINGLAMRATLSSLGLTACHPITAARCSAQLSIFNNEYALWAGVVAGLLQAVPILIGVFTGGPLLARELETGTFRFAWTQGAGRTRWVLAKLVLLAVPLAGAASLFSLLFSWWYQPFFAQGRTLMGPGVFDLSGTAFAAWTLGAFAIGAFAGVVIRRVVAVIGTAFAASAGLAVMTALYLRDHVYQAPVVVRLTRQGQQVIPARSFTVSTQLTYPDGRPVGNGAVSALLNQARSANLDPVASLIQHHIGQTVAYQPESRFWPFQLIECGWLLALALILGAVTVWLVRRRAG